MGGCLLACLDKFIVHALLQETLQHCRKSQRWARHRDLEDLGVFYMLFVICSRSRWALGFEWTGKCNIIQVSRFFVLLAVLYAADARSALYTWEGTWRDRAAAQREHTYLLDIQFIISKVTFGVPYVVRQDSYTADDAKVIWLHLQQSFGRTVLVSILFFLVLFLV